jgi:hypothetical protein
MVHTYPKGICVFMTCYIEDERKDGGHIHFVDGENGGYCLAAKQMKWQIRRSIRMKREVL